MAIPTLLDHFSNGLFLCFVAGIPLYGYLRKVKVYECFIDGAKDGFQLVVKIAPYIVAILVAITMLRASGAIDLLVKFLSPVLSKTGIHAEILPLALVRPLSGSAANGVLVDIIHTYGANSLIAHTAATLAGSTETIFYVVAVYFGAAGIRRTQYVIPVALAAEVVGIFSAVWVCRWLL